MKIVKWEFIEDGNEQIIIKDTKDFYETFNDLFKNLTQEEFHVFFMDVNNYCIGHEQVAKGVLNSVWTHSREVFRSAIVSSCHHIIVAHNHPSGVVGMNEEDYELTKTLVYSGNTIGIEVLDSVVFGENCYYSYYESGQLEKITKEIENG